MSAGTAAVHGLPGYWRYEVSGKLKEAVLAYLDSQTGGEREFTVEHLKLMRAYLRHYIEAPCWNPWDDSDCARELEALRLDVRGLASADEIRGWLSKALDLGIDPL